LEEMNGEEVEREISVETGSVCTAIESQASSREPSADRETPEGETVQLCDIVDGISFSPLHNAH
jgi:hypothetical protein